MGGRARLRVDASEKGAPEVRRLTPSLLIPVTLAVPLVPILLHFAAGCGPQPPVAPFHTDSTPPNPLITSERRAEFVGSEACRSCHPAEFNAHADSLHAQTLFSAADPRIAKLFKTDQVLKDPALQADYSFHQAGEKAVLRVKDKQGRATDLPTAYGFGSNRYGMTPVYERDGVYLEGRTSYYATLGKWFWTPGQQDRNSARQPEGRIVERDEAVRCFLCHSTAVVQTDTQAVGPESIFHVGCERCHGPGRDHVAAARRGKKGGGLYTYSGASGSTVLQLCAQCHRPPTDSVTLELENSKNLPRFAGTALAASECFKRSAGKLTCTTCHNPHSRVVTDASTYEAACLGCHTRGAQQQKPCPVNPRSGCVSCHMPLQGIDFPGNPKFHNHWIRPYPGLGQASAAR